MVRSSSRSDRFDSVSCSWHGEVTLGGDDDDGARNRDSKDINARSFNAAQYVKHALREKGLGALLAEDKRLTDEVHVLDNDMQNLVYENYSKFISQNNSGI